MAVETPEFALSSHNAARGGAKASYGADHGIRGAGFRTRQEAVCSEIKIPSAKPSASGIRRAQMHPRIAAASAAAWTANRSHGRMRATLIKASPASGEFQK